MWNNTYHKIIKGTNMKKYTTTVLISTLAAVLLFNGCGDSDSTKTLNTSVQTTSSDSDKAEKTIKVSYDNWEKMMKNADVSSIKTLLSHGVDLNDSDTHGFTLLHYATLFNKSDIVHYLISKGAHVNAKDKKRGYTPLYYAAKYGYKELVEYLLANGADANSKSKDNATPLQRAAEKGHLDIVKLLVSHGADINVKDNYSMTALHFAVQKRHFDIIKYLVSHGAKLEIRDSGGDTPLSTAKSLGYSEIAKYLISKGAKQ